MRLFFFNCFKQIIVWANFNNISRLVAASLIIVFGKYLVIQYYLKTPFVKFTIKWISSIDWLLAFLIISIFSFIIGFVIEIYSIWETGSKKINITLKTLGIIAPFISSYFARWIIVYLIGLEPATFSRSLIIFSVIIGILFWILLSILVLSLIYLLTVFIQILTLSFNPIFYISLIRNNTWYRFWTKKRKDIQIDKKIKNSYVNSFLFSGGRGLGAVFLACFLSSILDFSFEYIPLTINKYSWLQIAENIIVYADYRPGNKVSECTDLKPNDWGLLIGYKKISVAEPQESGGYLFTTKSCSFENNT